MHVNPEQKRAIETIKGRVLVLAGAGSGKTSVLVQRCINLLSNHLVPPSAILGLTFTNKAAEEMRARIAKYVSPQVAKEVTLSTFHSFCFWVLKQEIHHLGYTNTFTVYDEKDRERLLLTLEKQLKIEHEKEDIEAEVLISEFMKSLKAYNAVDFEGLLTLTLELFQKVPSLLEKYQDRFKYIMIDEYQDTNETQFALADLLARKYGNLFVVGDDDQSIYSWRGAKVKHILEFNHHAIVKLEQNYRSTKTILDAANAVIRNNQERHEKTLWSSSFVGDQIHLFHAHNDREEAHAVIDRILRLRHEKGLAWKDFAILYRSNTLSRPFEMALLQAPYKDGDKFVRGIPYRVVQGMEFNERAEIKDVVAYLKVLVNPKDHTPLLRILNYPKRGISIHAIEILNQMSKTLKLPLFEVLHQADNSSLSPQAKAGVQNFIKLMTEAKQVFETKPLTEAMKWFVEKIQIKEALKDEFKSEKAIEFKWENIQTLISMTENEENLSLHDFLSMNALDGLKYNKKERSQDRVNLLTFHSAKGLEFTACFLVAIEDRYLPHEKSLLEGNLEEERRLFYVAITRAKKYLTISMAKNRTVHGKEKPTNPSRFLFELPKELILVEHSDRPLSFLH
ncbi:MAG: ATP-dependent DNA helicase [Chlamydiae bacterium]|jgi:superfamily I DNA/RNA helicase|nr:ATP-dependent DNA helicase [Chlamydiota bacterium]